MSGAWNLHGKWRVRDNSQSTVPVWKRLNRLEQKRAYKTAMRALGWRRWIPSLPLPFMAAHPLATHPFNLIIMSIASLSIPLLFIVLYRAPIQRACWAILAAHGEPICTACGYNLTGNVAGRCPECGRQTNSVDSVE